MVRYTLEARVHLDAIGVYTEETWGIEQRNVYMSQLFAGVEAIGKSPLTGRRRDELATGMRSKRIQKHIAYYFVRKTHVLIVGVLHERMEPSQNL